MASKLLLVQILRAAAALSVAMLHAQHDAATLAARLGQGFMPIHAFPWEAGVDVFFVISGFIMVQASARLFEAPNGPRLFLTRRIARIVPIYWAVTTLYLAAVLASPTILNTGFLGWWPVVASYLFIPVARPDGLVQPVYGLGWTLNYEMFFYTLFALALRWPRRRAVPGLMLALATLVVLGRSVAPLPAPLGFWTDPIILEFAYGLALGLVYAGGVRLRRLARLTLAAAALALLVIVATGFEVTPSNRFVVYGVPAALLVAAVAFGREREAADGLIARLGALLGDASYALYLIHPFVIRAALEAAWSSGVAAALGPGGFIVLSLLASLLFSLLVYRLLERPTTQAVRHRLRA